MKRKISHANAEARYRQACSGPSTPNDALLLPNNEVLFRSLSRKAKVKPSYLPRLKERYHCHAAAEFAAAYYRDTGKVLMHDAVKRVIPREAPGAAEGA